MPRPDMTTATRAPGDDGGALSRTGGVPDGSGSPPLDLLDLDAAFRKALPCILTMARRRGFTADEAEDIAQRVGLRMVKRKDAYDPAKGTPAEWVIGIARNILREARRAARTQARYFCDGAPEGLDGQPSDDLTPEERARASAALGIAQAALTEQQRKVLELTIEGCTAQQVAEILDLRVTMVEFRLKEARARLAAVLKRLGEDPSSITNVRGAVLPLFSVDDLERAWRAHLDSAGPRVDGVPASRGSAAARDDAADDGEGNPPNGPAARHPSSPAPPLGAPPSHPVRGLLRRVTIRAALPAMKLGAAGSTLYIAGVLTGLVLAGPSGADGDRGPRIVAEPVHMVTMETSSATAVPAATVLPAAAPAPAATVAPAATPAPSVRTDEIDPETMSESELLRVALASPPRRALHWARVHERRFPSRSAGKREMIFVHALVGLGRRSEAAQHARRLAGTLYAKQAEAALGGPPP